MLHKRELMRLLGEVSQRGVTLVPLRIYFNEKGLAKVAIGLARSKKKADKKQKLKERDIDRETMRELKKFN